jgi:hypothetical protein
MSNVHTLPASPASPDRQRPLQPDAPAPARAYAELAVTTNFSFLRGASQPEELVVRARELGLAGLGIADRNSVAGVVRAHMKAKAPAEDGEAGAIKLAVGARLVFADGTHDILTYPQDRAAWGRLTRLLSIGKSRADKGDCILFARFPGALPLLPRRTESHRISRRAAQGFRHAPGGAGRARRGGRAPALSQRYAAASARSTTSLRSPPS